MKTAPLLALTMIAGASLSALAEIDASKLPPPSTQKGVAYAQDIKPLLQASCFRCHGAERPKAGLRLDSLEALLKGSKDGPVLEKGNSAKSFIVKAVSQLDPETAMPPKRRPGGPGKRGGKRTESGPSGFRGTNAPAGGPGGNFQPPKPLTPEQVGLIRAWIDQGAR